MTNICRRLRTLEAQLDSARKTWDDRDEAVFWDYSRPAIAVVGREYAWHKALRRFLAIPGPHPDRLRRPELPLRDALVQRELDGLVELLEAHDAEVAFRLWLAEPGEQGWPALEHDTYYDAFTARLARFRQQQDYMRGREGEHGIEWRRRNPSWRPGMTPVEATIWEVSIAQFSHKERAV